MRPISSVTAPKGAMVVLTSGAVEDGGEAMAADFRDMAVLSHKASGALLGVSSAGVRLCARPAFMVEGVWFAEEDHEACRRFPNLVLSPGDMVLVPVE